MDLQSLRDEIDGIDGQLLDLFLKRMETAGKVAAYKKEHALTTLQQGREREILSRVTKAAGDKAGYAKILFSTLMDLSRSYQNRLLKDRSALKEEIARALETTPKLFPDRGTVACQGVEGAYSQIACDKLFAMPDIVYVRSFEGVFQAVEQGLCEYGVLPIENSSHGTVSEVYDLMRHYKFHILRSIKVQINHMLLANPGAKKETIREIFSHEQALGQCAAYLKQFPDAKITVVENTAVAAKRVGESGRTDVAAISSRDCAALYGLAILEEDVQDAASNFTRFICITKELRIYPGASRISLMLSLPHRPGALYAMIAKFSALGLNLIKIESRPIPGRDFEFLFYFDMEASVYSDEVLSLLGELSEEPELFILLGCYSEV